MPLTPDHLRAELFSRMPDELREVHPTFGRPYMGTEFDSYLEGARFDAKGNLYVVDIPHSRVLRIDADGCWATVSRYQGRPKGLEVHRDGRLFVTDNLLGIMEVAPATGDAKPTLTRTAHGPLRACNDLFFTFAGDLLFTDQAASSLIDPTGTVFRWGADGRVKRLIDNVPGPNGIVTNLDESQIFVSATRANAIWNLQLSDTGDVERVGVFAHLPGGFGPDGLTLDAAGGLIVAQPGIGVFRFNYRGKCTHIIELPVDGLTTTVAFGPEGNRLYITDAMSGSIYCADLPAPGKETYAKGCCRSCQG